ncbi:MAG: cupin domain-containing protein [Eubacteriales bacterium]
MRKYDPYLESTPISLSTHKGQELDYVLSGTLKIQLGDRVEILNEGDSVLLRLLHTPVAW